MNLHMHPQEVDRIARSWPCPALSMQRRRPVPLTRRSCSRTQAPPPYLPEGWQHEGLSQMLSHPGEDVADDVGVRSGADGREEPGADAGPSNRLLEQLRRAVVAETRVDPTAAQEIDRLRNFLLYCICVDYRCRPSSVTLSAEDRDHFTTMCLHLKTNAEVCHKLTAADREELAPYFWHYIHQPCVALGLPAEYVAAAVIRFGKYQTAWGTYKGSALGVLHSQGCEKLALKICVDTNLVLPVLDPRCHRDITARILDFSDQYFVSIKGISHTVSGGLVNVHVHEVDFTLTERGKAYEASRDGTLRIIERFRANTTVFRDRVNARLEMLKKRKEVYPIDEVSDLKASETHWDDRHPDPYFLPALQEDWIHPLRWWHSWAFHLLDLFERRHGKGSCDV